MGARAAKVLVRRARLEAATQEHSAVALRGTQRKLVEGEGLTAGLLDALASTLREAQGANRQLRERDALKADVVRDGTDRHCDLRLVALHVAGQARQADRRAVVLARLQALQHHLVEAAVRAAREELVQLHKQVHIHILGLGRSPVLVVHAAAAGNEILALWWRSKRSGELEGVLGTCKPAMHVSLATMHTP